MEKQRMLPGSDANILCLWGTQFLLIQTEKGQESLPAEIGKWRLE